MDTMRPLVKEADVVIPLAALVGAPLCDRDPLAATLTKKQAIVDMLGLLNRDQRVLLYRSPTAGTASAKGQFCTEETPIGPISLYGTTKSKQKKTCSTGPIAITLRLATVFGMSPRMRLDLLVNDFTYRAVEQLFRKSPAPCAVQPAWKPDTNGHSYQLFESGR